MAILSASQVYYLAQRYIGCGANPTIMTAICRAESGANTLAVSPTHDYGLWQINYAAHSALFSRYGWRQPADNAKMAGIVFCSQHYGAWVTYNTGAYIQYLPWARSGSRNPAPVGGTAGAAGTPASALDLGGEDVDTQIRAVSHQLWWGGHDLYNYSLAVRRYRSQLG